MSVTAVFNLRFVWFERAARDDVRQLDDAPVGVGCWRHRWEARRRLQHQLTPRVVSV